MRNHPVIQGVDVDSAAGIRPHFGLENFFPSGCFAAEEETHQYRTDGEPGENGTEDFGKDGAGFGLGETVGIFHVVFIKS